MNLITNDDLKENKVQRSPTGAAVGMATVETIPLSLNEPLLQYLPLHLPDLASIAVHRSD